MARSNLRAPVGGPGLSDGTSFSDLIDINAHGVSARALMDPEVWELELRTVWVKNWVFVAHESEIPSAGDFVQRQIGIDPVIVSRDSDSTIHVLLNVCSHRGGQVCRPDAGNAQTFTCPYHGWLYGNDGSLLGVPLEREMYKGRLQKQSLGLRSARVAIYHGLIFAVWDPEAPSFEEFLGDFKFYSDMVFGPTEGGWEVAGPPQRWIINVNWKIPAENFTGDAYHAINVHLSETEAGRVSSDIAYKSQWGVNITEPRFGHGGRCTQTIGVSVEAEADLAALLSGLYPGIPRELHDQIKERLSPAQFELVRAAAIPIVGTIFPNFTFMVGGVPYTVDGPPEPAATIRTWNPCSPNSVEVVSWPLVQRDAPDAMKDRGRQALAYSFGSSGTLEQDDSEAWSQIQRGIRGAKGRHQWLLYNSTEPPSKENWLGDEPWPGPGEVRHGFSTDDNQWNWWVRWYECVTS